tara:strand:+ start:246 stop:497 length:252 start_codon:yes stop_codon:yes gene_type:complete
MNVFFKDAHQEPHMTHIYITKTCGDYERNGQYVSGDFWKIEVREDDSAEMVRINCLPGSRSKKSVIESIRHNFGWDAKIWVSA